MSGLSSFARQIRFTQLVPDASHLCIAILEAGRPVGPIGDLSDQRRCGQGDVPVAHQSGDRAACIGACESSIPGLNILQHVPVGDLSRAYLDSEGCILIYIVQKL